MSKSPATVAREPVVLPNLTQSAPESTSAPSTETPPAAPSVETPKVKFDQAHLDGLTTKSAKIRYLNAQGMKTGEIAKTQNIIYQHVRNVLITPVKVPKS